MTQRICFRLHVAPERLDEYRRRHAAVWPEMLEALQQTGWRNYSLFAQDDGDITGYLECENFAASKAAMAELAINAKWQKEMAELFVGLDAAMPDEAMEPIAEIFHLD